MRQQIPGIGVCRQDRCAALGPHFSAEVPEYMEMLKDYNVKVTSIDPDLYASLDGEGILEEAIELYNGSGR